MKKYRLAIVGATGLVGRTVLKVLEERSLPISEYVLFASKKSAGKIVHFMREEYVVNELDETSFDTGFDFAIFCAGGETSKKYAPIASAKGCIVVDNSSAFRMDENVPLVVPEVNGEEIQNNNGIIANPNCSTIQAVVALKPLDNKYKIKRIVYSTYQAVSGSGRNGVIDLENGVKNYLTDLAYCNNVCPNDNKSTFEDDYSIPENNLDVSFSRSENYKLLKFPYPIFSNCLPHIDVFLDNGYTKEEEKMINETRKILSRPDLKITSTAVRIPVFNCHGEAINVEFENDFDMSELISVLKVAPGLVVQDDISDNIYPTASFACDKDEVFVGRIRRDTSVPYGVNLWVVADNIRKGAATNAVQIVEKLCV